MKEISQNLYRTRGQIEQIVIFQRLYLYNQGAPCGAKAIRKILYEQCVRPLPSIRTINRILSRNCLTHGRTGYYAQDDGGQL
jgi:hypothetical protein